MAGFSVKPQMIQAIGDDVISLSGMLGEYENTVETIGKNLAFQIACKQQLKTRLMKVSDVIDQQSTQISRLGKGLISVSEEYCKAENRILGKSDADGGNLIDVSGDAIPGWAEKIDTDEDFWKKFFSKLPKKSAKGLFDILGKAGEFGKSAALVSAIAKMLIDGDGITAKDIGSLIKGMGNSIIGIAELDEFSVNKFFGLDKFKTISLDKTSAGWLGHLKDAGKSFKDTMKDQLSIKDADGIKGSKIAGWGLSLVANGFSNYEEYQKDGISKGRAVAETVTETLIDIGKGAALTAGVAAGAALIGVSAPAVVVGGIAVAASTVMDVACEALVGKGFTEAVSDFALDTVSNVADGLVKGTKSVAKAVSGWASKLKFPPKLALSW